MSQSEQINEIAAALAKAQGEMKNAAFDAKNPHFGNRYATLAAILDVVRPALSKNGIAIVQAKELNGNGLQLVTRFIHSSGQWLGDTHPLPNPANVKYQEFGSALTYAKRYSLSSLAGVSADQDEDANIVTAAKKYGTTLEDVIEHELEYDQDGNAIDNIPPTKKRLEKLSKAMGRTEYASLLTSIKDQKTLPDLLTCGLTISDRAATLPDDWYRQLQDEYRKKQIELGWVPKA